MGAAAAETMTARASVSARATLSLESSVADRIRDIQAVLSATRTGMRTSTMTMARLDDDGDDREALRHGLDNIAEAFRGDAYYYSDTESETDDV